jgi:hypothetical protein
LLLHVEYFSTRFEHHQLFSMILEYVSQYLESRVQGRRPLNPADHEFLLLIEAERGTIDEEEHYLVGYRFVIEGRKVRNLKLA